jgi:hypothetical protein
MERSRRAGMVATGLVTALLAASVCAADASPSPVVLTGPSPLAHCPGLPGTVTNFTAEPHLAVNPTDGKNIVAAWQQDRSYGARGNVVTSSHDGGHTWHEVTVPGASTCTPGQVGVADAWLTFDGAGTVYLASLAGRPDAHGQVVAGLLVNRSSDGGLTWSEPSMVTNFETFDDKPTITADPHQAGVVYATWDRPAGCGTDPCPSQVHFARSTDGARTWSDPQVVVPRALRQHNARVFVLPDGGLRLFYVESSPTAQPGPDGVARDLRVVASSDGGAHWSEPSTVLPFREFIPADAQGRQFYAKFNEAVTADGRGNLYVATTENTSTAGGDPSAVRLRVSTDGGTTWEPPQTLARPAGHSTLPSIAVNAHGRVAVTWYDFEDDQPGDAQWTLAYRATDGLVGTPNWPRRTLSHFDALACGNFSVPGLPGPKLPWIGEYFGLAALEGARFGTAYSVCAPAARVGLADVVFGTF